MSRQGESSQEIALSTGKKSTVSGSIQGSEEPVLDPGHHRRPQRAEPEPVDRLESGLVEHRLELLEGVSVADVPAVLVTGHADPIGVRLPVAVGRRDVDEPVVVQEVVDLPQSLLGIHDVLDHVEQEHLVVPAVLGGVGGKLVEPAAG